MLEKLLRGQPGEQLDHEVRDEPLAERVERAVNPEVDLVSAMRNALDVLNDEFKFDYADVWLLDEQQRPLRGLAYRLGKEHARSGQLRSVPEIASNGKDYVAYAALRDRPVVTPNISRPPKGAVCRRHWDKARSQMVIPLAVNGLVLGAVTLESARAGRFTSRDAEHLMTAAHSMAARLVEARELDPVLRREQDYRSRFLAFEKLNREIGNCRDLEQLLKACADAIPRIIRSCDFCNILICDDDKQQLHLLGEGVSEAVKAGYNIVPKILPMADSITGEVVRKRTLGKYYNVEKNPLFFLKQYRDDNRLTGMLSAPMISTISDRVLGCINLYSTIKNYRFSEAEVSLLATIADVLAVAIVNLERTLELTVEKMTLEFLQAAGSDINLDRLARKICPTLRCEACSIFMLEDRTLLLKGSTGIEGISDYSKVTYVPGEGMTGWVAQTGRSLRLMKARDAYARDAGPGLNPKHKFVESLPGRSKQPQLERGFLCVPVRGAGRVMGVIRAFGKTGELPFTPLDQMLLTAIANQLGSVWLESTRVSAQSRRSRAIIDVVELLHARGDEREVLRQAVRIAMTAVRADTGDISFYTEQDGKLHFYIYEPDSYESRALMQPRIATPDTLIGTCYSGQKGINCPDMAAPGTGARPICSDLHSSLLVPLTCGADRLGVLACDSFQIAFFTDDDLATLSCIGHVLATVIKLNRVLRQQEQTLTEQDELMSTLVHQLVAPLAGMKSHCDELFEEEAPTPAQWEYKRNMLQSSCELAASIALNFRAIRKILHDPKYKLNLENVSIAHMLLRLAYLYGPIAAAKGMKISVDKKALGSLSRITADRMLLAQVFQNLIDNAIKYSLRDTSILIDLEQETPAEFTLRIQNVGIPIPEDRREKVFEMGYRDATAQAWSPVGTGLGLAVARKIIRLHRGRIWVASKLSTHKAGAAETCFFVNLPVTTTYDTLMHKGSM